MLLNKNDIWSFSSQVYKHTEWKKNKQPTDQQIKATFEDYVRYN